MFINTRAVSKKIIEDTKVFSAVYSIIIQLIYVAFLCYALFSGCGSTVLNVILLSISTLFELFLIFSFARRNNSTRTAASKIKHAYHIASLSLRAVSLGIAVYGIHISFAELDTVSLVFTVFMLVGWVSGILIEFFKFIIERYTALMTSALSKDTEPFVRIYNKLTFKSYEGREEKDADSYVDKIASEYKQELKEKRESKKALLKAERILKRDERRAAFREKLSRTKAKIESVFKKNKK
ncbi:MAG: hypothetical protein E7673_00360 [Ruminococcaceae bacterium]|nr:hypothetical protein [Oscillospiraceae bacterium]